MFNFNKVKRGPMRKIYIFITDDIRLMGGIQRYTLAKIDYLLKEGYEVFIFFDGFSSGMCKFEELNAYISDEIPGLRILPYEYPNFLLNIMIWRMCHKLGNIDNSEVIIESHSHVAAIWGELLASKIGAKHMCFLCNELFYGEGKHYSDRLDFYSFKYDRKELYGISENSISDLFGDYRKIDNSSECKFCAAMGSAVRDIECKQLDLIQDVDWSIGYVGRTNKLYVPNIVNGIKGFSKLYPDKKIQFVIVGDTKQNEYIFNPLDDCENVSVIKLGDLSPIPLKLFKMLDVVIAGSGCAYYAAISGAPTIVADAKNYKANGVLGYDTQNYIFANPGDKQYDFVTAIKRVLIEKCHVGKNFNLYSAELDDTKKHFDKQLRDSCVKEYGKVYYDRCELLKKVTNNNITFRKTFSALFPKVILLIREVREKYK